MTDGQPTSRRDDWFDFWERRELRFVIGLPYALLGLAAALDLATRHRLTEAAGVDLALAASALVVMATMDVLRYPRSGPRWGRSVGPASFGRGAMSAAGFALLYGLMAALVIRAPVFGFFSFTGYFWAFRLLWDRSRLLGVAAVAMLSAISQTGSFPYHGGGRVTELVVVYLINAGVAVMVSWFGWMNDERGHERAREISELTEANAKLEQSMRRNAELHEQLLGQARAAGVAQERGRMAREIHDTLAQGLTGIVTQLQAAQRAGATGGPGAAHIETAIGLARDSLAEARRSVAALRPEPLAAARLPEAVQEVAERWSELNHVTVSIATTGTVRVVRPEIEVALLRTAQEALANVAKHARATRVGLTLSYMEDLVTLDVRDDGVGFCCDTPPPDHHEGFGLHSMRQRVEGVAGTFQIESEPHAGTAISASIPVGVA